MESAAGSNTGWWTGSEPRTSCRHRAGMARNLVRFEFSTFLEMAAHLDAWAAEHLTDPAAWQDALVGSQAWLDYSARNQVLLASYRADGPVAGAETWRLVPSTTEGRGCAVRAGEHGYPVRVPVTTGGSEPDPYLGGHRPTRAAVARWEWRPVFSVDQLARRPAPDALLPVEIPQSLAGPQSGDDFLVAVRKTATATVRGRLPRSEEPHRVLADAAGRLRRSSKRALHSTLSYALRSRGWLPSGWVTRPRSVRRRSTPAACRHVNGGSVSRTCWSRPGSSPRRWAWPSASTWSPRHCRACR